MCDALQFTRPFNSLRPLLFLALLLFATGAYAQNSIMPVPAADQKELKEKSTGIGPDANGIYCYTEEMPQCNVDISPFLAKNIRYPKKAKKKNIQGRVVLKFVVDKDGSVRDIKVKSTPDEILSDEAIRVVKLMPKWKPAKQNGVVVPVYFTLPVVFK